MLSRYQELLKQEFTRELQVRTGWGRNDVISAFERASTKATMLLFDETIGKGNN
jgi:hypothetical protein